MNLHETKNTNRGSGALVFLTGTRKKKGAEGKVGLGLNKSLEQ